MKIAFWSNVRGQCGTTLHTTCMASIQALFDKEKVVLMENHQHVVNIETCLCNSMKREVVCEGGTYNAYGLESIMDRFSRGYNVIEEAYVKKCTVTYGNDRMFYLPHGHLSNMDLFDYQLGKNMEKLFDVLESYFDTVYIDTFAAESFSTKAILEAADIVVVNLNQNSSVLAHFFNNFSSFRYKSVYLIGNYYKGYNTVEELRRKYQIDKRRVFAIPYCMEAAESESRGCISNFINRNYLSPSMDNREFIEALKDAYIGIMSCAYEKQERHSSCIYRSSVSSLSSRALSLM